MINNFLVNRSDEQVIKNIKNKNQYTIKYTEPILTLVKSSDLCHNLINDKIIFKSEPLYNSFFLDRIDKIVHNLYEHGFAISGQVILAKIHNESAGTYCPYILNNKGFIGLIQFNTQEKAYQEYFNASNEIEMINICVKQTNVDQLDQVEKYITNWLKINKNNFLNNNFPLNEEGKIIIDPATIYCLTFLPAFAYKSINADLAEEWEKTGKGRTAKDLISRNPGLSPDGKTIPKNYLATVLKQKTNYTF